MSIDEILSNFMFLLIQDDIKLFDDLVTLKVDLNKISGNEHIFGFRTLFSKMENEIDPTLTIRLSFIDSYKNEINEIVRQASLDAIKEIYKYKFYHEGIDFLIGNFAQNLSANEKCRFSVVKDSYKKYYIYKKEQNIAPFFI